MARILISVLVASASLWSVLPAYGAEKLPGDRTGRFWRKEPERKWEMGVFKLEFTTGTHINTWRRVLWWTSPKVKDIIYKFMTTLEVLRFGYRKGQNTLGMTGVKYLKATYDPSSVDEHHSDFNLYSILPIWYNRVFYYVPLDRGYKEVSFYLEGSLWGYVKADWWEWEKKHSWWDWETWSSQKTIGPYLDTSLKFTFKTGRFLPLTLKAGARWFKLPKFKGAKYAPMFIRDFYIGLSMALEYRPNISLMFCPPKGVYISLLHLSDADGDGTLSVGETGQVLLGLANGADKVRKPKISVEISGYKGYIRMDVKEPKVSNMEPGERRLLEFELTPLRERLMSLPKDFRFYFRLKVKVKDDKGFTDEQEEEFVVIPAQKELPVVNRPPTPALEGVSQPLGRDFLPPVILVSAPHDGQKLSGRAKVMGMVLDDNRVKDVRIDGVSVSRRSGRGIKVEVDVGFEAKDMWEFETYWTPKQAGENSIKVEAWDAAGNRAYKVIPVVYTPSRAPRAMVWAVVVGVSKFRDPRVRGLRYTDKDALSFYDYLRSPYGGAVEHDRAKLLVNERATRAEILKAVKDVLKRAFEDDMVILYFATHGMVDADTDELYFLGYDTDPTNLLATGIAQSDLERLMRISKAGKVVFITDACHSGGLGIALAMRGQEEVARFLAKVAEAKDGIAVLSASSANEFSQEGERWGGGHGVFTYYLLRGLKGEADFDADGIVTIREAYDYLYRKVAEDTAGGQHPELKGNFDNNLPLGIVR